MNTIYKLIFTWMLTIVGSLLLPIMSVADVSDTMYGAPFTTTTPSVFITEHTVSLRSTPLGINGNTSIAHPVDTWNIIKNDYSSRWNSGDIREMGSVVGEGLITLLTAGVKYADNAGRLGKTGSFIQKLKKLKNLKRLRKLKAQKKIQVTSWADKGIKPDFNSGRWVMKGGPTKVNFWKSGLPGPKVVKSSKFPYFHIQKSQADFSNFITKEVPRTSLKLPPGPEIIKAPLGQRILKGGN